MKTTELTKTFGLIFLILSSVWGGYMIVESRYAKAANLLHLESRVVLNELASARIRAMNYVYFLRDQSRKYPNDERIKQQLIEAEKEVKLIDKQIEQLKQ